MAKKYKYVEPELVENENEQKVIEPEKQTKNSLEIATEMMLSARAKKSKDEEKAIINSLMHEGYKHDSFTLGKKYLFGDKGIKPNFELAISYFTSSGENGNYYAYLALAKIYEIGIEAPVDLHKAYYYYALAYNAGCNDLECFAKIGINFYFGINNMINYVKAATFFEHVLINSTIDIGEKWLADSAYFYGNIYYEGHFRIKKDYKLAYSAYLKAKNNGCSYRDLDIKIIKSQKKAR